MTSELYTALAAHLHSHVRATGIDETVDGGKVFVILCTYFVVYPTVCRDAAAAAEASAALSQTNRHSAIDGPFNAAKLVYLL